MAARRRVVIWTVVSVGVAAAVVVPLSLWMLVFSPGARLRQAERLLKRYRSAPDHETARRLAHLADLEVLPRGKTIEVLRLLLAPAKVCRGRIEAGRWSPIEIHFLHGGLEFERLEVACGGIIAVPRLETVSRSAPVLPGVLRLDISSFSKRDISSFSKPVPLAPGPHETTLRILFTVFRTDPAIRERATRLLKDIEILALDDDPFGVGPCFYEVNFEVPFEFDVVEPRDAGRGK